MKWNQKADEFFSSVIAWSALIPMLVVIVSQLYWYVMVFLLKKLPHVPESDPLNGVNKLVLVRKCE